MKRAILGGVLALSMFSLAYAAGPEGQAVIEALTEKCGFVQVKENVPPGGGVTLKITEDTITKLKEMMKKGKGLHVNDGGTVEIVDLKK